MRTIAQRIKREKWKYAQLIKKKSGKERKPLILI